MPGDLWYNALAAHVLGVPAVLEAAGVPQAARTYVDTVNGYATWYARRGAFAGPDDRPVDSTPTTESKPSPTSRATPTSPQPSSRLDPSRSASPAPSRTGTPRPTASPRPPAPDVARGKPIIVSGTNKGSPEFANDGVNSTFWESTLEQFPQWLEVDLLAPRSVERVTIAEPAIWRSVKRQTLAISGSVDGNTFKPIVGSAEYVFIQENQNVASVSFTPVNVRYVRITFYDNSNWPGAQVGELGIYAW